MRQPDGLDDDPLTDILRQGPRQLLSQAVEAEVEAFLAAMKGERLADGRDRLVRHGHGPERQVQTFPTVNHVAAALLHGPAW